VSIKSDMLFSFTPTPLATSRPPGCLQSTLGWRRHRRLPVTFPVSTDRPELSLLFYYSPFNLPHLHDSFSHSISYGRSSSLSARRHRPQAQLSSEHRRLSSRRPRPSVYHHRLHHRHLPHQRELQQLVCVERPPSFNLVCTVPTMGLVLIPIYVSGSVSLCAWSISVGFLLAQVNL
jgi:hypothetical protein